MSEIMLDVGQANELKMAFMRNDWTNDEVKRLSEGNLLAGVRAVLSGTAKIKPVNEDANRFVTLNETTIAVNRGAAPNLPFNGAVVEQHVGEGWSILEKRADGLYLDWKKIVLFLSKRQKNGKWLKGYELREELTDKPVLNANILDSILINTHLIPEDWKKDENGNIRYVFFWGSIFRNSGRGLCVRCLCFGGGGWRSGCYWLDSDWSDSDPAALRAS